jgi:hypothetical protein
MNYDEFKEICQEEGVDHKEALDEMAQQAVCPIGGIRITSLKEWLRDTFKPEPTPHIEKVMQYMGSTGGGFTSMLSQAWFRADCDNRHKIEVVWESEIQSYRERLIGDIKQRGLYKEAFHG